MKRCQRRNLHNVSSNRRGAVLVVAIICVMLTTVLMATALKVAIRGRKQLRQDQLQMQAAWLASAGLARAAARLQTEPGYPGETWNVTADRLDGHQAAKVEISVKATDNEAAQRKVVVTATCPAGSATWVQRTRKAVINLKQP